MQSFDAEIAKDESGRLVFMELPFNAKDVFGKAKGPLFVKGSINGTPYRTKLLSRGGGRQVMVIDKQLQKALGFYGGRMSVRMTMLPDDTAQSAADTTPMPLSTDMDVLSAVITRRSIRKFTSEPVTQSMLNTVLLAGLCAPTAKN